MQISIEQIDPGLWQRLQLEAKHQGKDVSHLMLIALRNFLGWQDPNKGSVNPHNLDRLAGTWSDEDAASFEKATEFFNQIDPELWQ